MDRSPLYARTVSSSLRNDPRNRRNTQSFFTEANVAAPIGYDSKGRLTILVESPLEIRNGKIAINMKQLRKLLET